MTAGRAAGSDKMTDPLTCNQIDLTSSARRATFLAYPLPGAIVLDKMQHDLDPIAGDSEAVHQYGIDWSTRQCRELLDRGVDGLHFYTLNRSKSSRQIVENLRREGVLG